MTDLHDFLLNLVKIIRSTNVYHLGFIDHHGVISPNPVARLNHPIVYSFIEYLRQNNILLHDYNKYMETMTEESLLSLFYDLKYQMDK